MLTFTPKQLEEIEVEIAHDKGEDFIQIGKSTLSALLLEARYARTLEASIVAKTKETGVFWPGLRKGAGKDNKCV